MIRKRTNKVKAKKILRQERARKAIAGTTARPRLNIFKGSNSLVAQVIDDVKGVTVVGVSTASKELKGQLKGSGKASAEKLGKIVADKCKEKGVSAVVFDRGGNKFHGVVKAFADSAREAGLKF